MRKSHRCEEGLIYEGGVFLHVANFDQSPGGERRLQVPLFDIFLSSFFPRPHQHTWMRQSSNDVVVSSLTHLHYQRKGDFQNATR